MWLYMPVVISNHTCMGGILYLGGTAFRVWAKFVSQIYVAGDFNNWPENANPLAPGVYHQIKMND